MITAAPFGPDDRSPVPRDRSPTPRLTSACPLLVLRRPKATTGFWSWFTTIDHKKIGDPLRRHRARVLRGRRGRGAAHPAAARRARTARCSPRRSTTRCSRCTAPRWCSSWACRWRSRSATTSSRCRSARATSRSRGSTCSGTGSCCSAACSCTRASSSAARRTAGGSATRRSRARPIAGGALPGHGPDFWAVGIVLLGIGSTTSAINFIVTILNMRAPGMTLMRMPVFTWMMLVVAFLTVFAMPIITAALIMVFFDRNFDTTFFLATKGGDPLLYQHLFWLFGHPEVYILILPGHGHRVRGAAGVLAQAAVRLLGRGVLGHRDRLPRLGRVGAPHVRHRASGRSRSPPSGSRRCSSRCPTGVKIFNWLGTVYGGAVKLTTAMLFSLGFIAMFTLGGLSGVLHSIVPADTQQTDTYFVVAHFHYVLVRRPDARDLLGLLLLVAEGLRAHARRAPRQDRTSGSCSSGSTSRSSRCTSSASIGHAAPHVPLRRRPGLGRC